MIRLVTSAPALAAVVLVAACGAPPDAFDRDAAWCRRAAAPPPTTGSLSGRSRVQLLDLDGPELATGDTQRRYLECMAARFRERFPEAPLPRALGGEGPE